MTNPREVTTVSGKMRLVCNTCGLSHSSYQATAACCAPKRETLRIGDIPNVPSDFPEIPVLERVLAPVKAPELLGRAAALMHERGKTYDEPEGERSMGKTVAAFNAVTGRDLTESEGWLLMCLLKAVRAASRKEPHRDSHEDLIAYAALLAEARLAGR
jgi:hypothetical protein